MRRLGVIVALGALLGVFGGAVTASPALAGGRGDGWEFQDFGPGFTTTNCGFLIVATQDVDQVFAEDGHGARRVYDHAVHRPGADHVDEPGEQQECHDQHLGPGEDDGER